MGWCMSAVTMENSTLSNTKWSVKMEIPDRQARFEAKGLHGFLPKTQTIIRSTYSFPVRAWYAGASLFGSGDGNVCTTNMRSGSNAESKPAMSLTHHRHSQNWQLLVSQLGQLFLRRSTHEQEKKSGVFRAAKTRSSVTRLVFESWPLSRTALSRRLSGFESLRRDQKMAFDELQLVIHASAGFANRMLLATFRFEFARARCRGKWLIRRQTKPTCFHRPQ